MTSEDTRPVMVPSPFPRDGTVLQQDEWVWEYGGVVFIYTIAFLILFALLWLYDLSMELVRNV